jgi:hypothetical protein
VRMPPSGAKKSAAVLFSRFSSFVMCANLAVRSVQRKPCLSVAPMKLKGTRGLSLGTAKKRST